MRMFPLARGWWEDKRRKEGLPQNIFLPCRFIRPVFDFHYDSAGFQGADGVPLADGDVQGDYRAAGRGFDCNRTARDSDTLPRRVGRARLNPNRDDSPASACSYPGEVPADPRVPGGWNRFKVRKISERLQGRADKKGETGKNYKDLGRIWPPAHQVPLFRALPGAPEADSAPG